MYLLELMILFLSLFNYIEGIVKTGDDDTEYESRVTIFALLFAEIFVLCIISTIIVYLVAKQSKYF